MQEQLKDPFAADADSLYGDGKPVAEIQMPQLPVSAGNRIQVSAGIITAQKDIVPRDERRIVQKLKALAGAAGERHVYGWNVKNKDGTFSRVEGATVKLAMDLVRCWGNCQVDCLPRDDGTHITFLARFVDYETGYSLTRPFQQRKRQNIGDRMESERAADMVFQIGASKAIRNVIVNAMPQIKDIMVRAAKNGLLERIKNNPEGCRTFLLGHLQELDIPLPRVEAKFGVSWKDFTVQDLTLLYQELESIAEGFLAKDNAYPADAQTLDAKQAEAKARDAKIAAGAAGKKKAQAAPKKDRGAAGKSEKEGASDGGAVDQAKVEDSPREEEAEQGQRSEDEGEAKAAGEGEADAGDDPGADQDDGGGDGDQGGRGAPTADFDLEEADWG